MRLEGKSSREIAKKFNVSDGNIRSVIHRYKIPHRVIDLDLKLYMKNRLAIINAKDRIKYLESIIEKKKKGALSHYTPEEMEFIILCKNIGLSFKSIAEVLGRSKWGVKSFYYDYIDKKYRKERTKRLSEFLYFLFKSQNPEAIDLARIEFKIKKLERLLTKYK